MVCHFCCLLKLSVCDGRLALNVVWGLYSILVRLQNQGVGGGWICWWGFEYPQRDPVGYFNLRFSFDSLS